MNARKETIPSRAKPNLIPLLSALALAASLGVQGVATGNGTTSDETIGGLPGRGGWGGQGPHELEARPGFYLVGTVADVLASVVTVEGEGYEWVVAEGPDGLVRYEYYGDLEITLDTAELERRGVEMGVVAAPRIGVKARLSWDGGHGSLLTLAEGGRFELPLERLRGLGLLERSPVLTTYNRVTQRSRFEVREFAGRLTVRIEHH